MNEKKDGGPAFPGRDPVVSFRAGHEDCAQAVASSFHQGITIRDWFAGQASEDDIEYHTSYAVPEGGYYSHPCTSREEAKYRYADAMLAEREK